MGGLIIPKVFVEKTNTPIIFLGGPIRGAANWQDEAALKILKKYPEIFVISPRRGIRPEIEKYLVRGEENHFSRQRAWERHYLNLASKKGTIMFWLPKEVEHKCEKSYGAMTRMELGQWMTNYKNDKKISFVIGSDGEFSEIDTIKYDLLLDAPDKKVFETLEEAIEEALRIVLTKRV